jgi:ATP-grasp domain-containing protein/L-aminoacid ligase-like protein
MSRILILATTTGYQTRAFGDAAAALRFELVFATDRCHLIDDPWRDGAIPIRFHDEDASVAAIVDAVRDRPIDGVLVVGDRPTVIASRVAEALGLAWHPPAAAAIARNKQFTRERLRDADLPIPWFIASPIDAPPPALDGSSFPCVIKPAALSGSRGVMRANDARELDAAFDRLRALMRSPDVRAERDSAHQTVLVEGFIPGREYAVEALMHRGELHVVAVFDKPDPLDGPFFEETIYLTPAAASLAEQRIIAAGVERAAHAIGLSDGPVHAECRVNADGVFVLEAAARPIGGLCARALRLVPANDPTAMPRPFEELLLRHAVGESPSAWTRERVASGVMMVPIPRRGIFRGVEGVELAADVAHVEDVRITAKTDQQLLPLPEGASYLGFIFARADRAGDVDRALRDAHARLRFTIDPEFPMLTAAQIQYNP